MQDERGSTPYEGSFSSIREEEAKDIESIVEEEIKSELEGNCKTYIKERIIRTKERT